MNFNNRMISYHVIVTTKSQWRIQGDCPPTHPQNKLNQKTPTIFKTEKRK